MESGRAASALRDPGSESQRQPLPIEISIRDLEGQRPPNEIPDWGLGGQPLPNEILIQDLEGQPLPSEILERSLGGRRLPSEVARWNLVGPPPSSEIRDPRINGCCARIKGRSARRRGARREPQALRPRPFGAEFRNATEPAPIPPAAATARPSPTPHPPPTPAA